MSTSMIPWAGTVPAEITKEINQSISLLTTLAPARFNMEGFNARTALEFLAQPKLFDCKPESVIKALMNCVTLGLNMGTECALVPFKDECTLIVEFEGWMRLFAQIPGYKQCVTDVVRQGEDFDYDTIGGTISHKPNLQARKAPLEFVYCVIKFQDGTQLFEILDEDDVGRHRASARQGGNTPAWNNHEKEMWRKSAVKALAARYGGQLGLTGLIQQSNLADLVEYEKTGPNPHDARNAVINLFGQEPDESLFTSEAEAVEADVEESVGVNPKTEEDTSMEIREEESKINAIRVWREGLIKMARQLEMTNGAVKELIANSGGGGTEFGDITDESVLANIETALIALIEAAADT